MSSPVDSSRNSVWTLLFVALCARVILQLWPLLRTVQHSPEEDTATVARARIEASPKRRGNDAALPYDMDEFPGRQQVKTIYGTIQVFEWGPEDGEKILLVHGLGTPCIAMGDMAREFVSKGYRVMMFDLFGRGYSDAPNDLKHDARLYTTQILLVLASSPLPWSGIAAFHLVGFSLGGSISVAFAAYHASMLRSLTLIAPGGLIRTSHISTRSRFLYSSGLIPDVLRLRYIRESLEPRNGAPSADVPDQDRHADVEFDNVSIAATKPNVTIGDVIRWQLGANQGFVNSYLSTIRSALVYRRHDRIWRLLAAELRQRKAVNAPPGLTGGRICVILPDSDVIVVKDEFIEDSREFFGAADVEFHTIKGGHEAPVSRAKEVAAIAMSCWTR
ncbi:putative alpha/beta fold family hydrolase [Pseudovirgaria hyperparasitica]|uniref:Alpha/beta fold family hydrolase n=1 Tax=Pseudovirgaria hyperparasitica TaxID=470096 RepID=A0A6A6WIE5_9PEZI|nr:putative alpha/beta fold family hydrolase [Pseudovirgaria hyperparasitica]KAF2761840.1 putative alpha/beta fold family hydrolase [Pseudovirgaria hyperparasitica]